MSALSGCTWTLLNPVSGPPLAEQGIDRAHETLTFNSADGTRLSGCFLTADQPKGTVVFADGAENVGHHIQAIEWLPEQGYNVLLFNYRSYGASQGEPSLPGFHDDLSAALRAADRIDGLPRSRLVLLGQSMGGSIATVVAANTADSEDWGALIIDSAPSSYRSAVQDNLARYWYTWAFQVPLSLLITPDYAARDAVPQLPSIPKLWIANPGDKTVPPHHVETLYELSTKPKRFWRIESRPHIKTFQSDKTRQRFIAWLDAALASRSQPDTGRMQSTAQRRLSAPASRIKAQKPPRKP